MKTFQIRVPEDLLEKVDTFVEKGLFRSRSHLLREALSKYMSEFNYIGALPYIIGPFSPSEIELLKKNPEKPLQISDSLKEKIQEDLNKIKG